MSSFDRLSHFKSIFDTVLHRPNFLKKYPKIEVLGPDRGKITIYGSNFQQVNLTPNGEYLLLTTGKTKLRHKTPTHYKVVNMKL